MFDISFAEISIVGVIGFIMLGPKEFWQTVKTVKNFIMDIKEHLQSYMKYFEEEFSEEKAISDVLFDDEGIAHITYDIEKLKPMFKKDINHQE